MGERSAPARPRLVLVALFALFFIPVVGALVMIAVRPGWTPFGTVNRGALLEPPVRLDALAAAQPLDGGPPLAARLSGKWALLHLAPGDCGEPCRSALRAQRQARLALGKDADRVERVWLVTADVPARTLLDVLQGFPGLHVARAPDAVPSLQPEPSPDAVFLVDPAGLIIMRYEGNGSASDMHKDMKRLLRISKQG